MTTQDTLRRYEKHLIANYGKPFPVLVRGEGCYLWDADGNRYLDFLAGLAVNALGYGHPRLVAAIREQAGKLLHTSNFFALESQARLAELLSERSFGGKWFFCNSGAEAVEAAIKLARLYGHGRAKIIAMANSFHGRTMGALSATGQTRYHRGLAPMLQGFVHVPFNDLEAVSQAVDDATVAVLLELIQGEGGIVPADRDYVHGLRKLCDEQGLLLIVDEVQTGTGRTGEYFAHTLYEVEPDILATAKGLGGGVAIGAMEAKPEVADRMTPGTHASTFGGNALACAAAIAVCETIEEEGLLAHVRDVGAYLKSALEQRAESLPFGLEARGHGLMLGLELDREAVNCKDVAKLCQTKGLLLNAPTEGVLRFVPPLVVTKELIDEGLEIVDQAVAETAKG